MVAHFGAKYKSRTAKKVRLFDDANAK